MNDCLASGPLTGTLELFPGRFVRTDTGKREAYTLSCVVRGRVNDRREVVVDHCRRVDHWLPLPSLRRPGASPAAQAAGDAPPRAAA